MALRWGVIGYGEAGSAFARSLALKHQAQVLVCDPVLREAASANSLRAACEGLGCQIVDSIPSLVTQADICFSLVTARVACDVARLASACSTAFIDFNSVSPTLKQHMAGLFKPGVFVGGAILGAIAGEGARTPLALDGPSSERIAQMLNDHGFVASSVSDSYGGAAALKLCRSIFMKGLECIAVEMLLAAETFNLREPVLRSVQNSFDTYGFRALIEMLVKTHAVHCSRRSDEMLGVSEMLREASLPAIMSEAAASLLRRSAESGVTAVDKQQWTSAEPVIQYLKQTYSEVRRIDA